MDTAVTYTLRRLRSSKDPEYAEAISVYLSNTPPSLKTDSNEITYWLDNYHKHFEDEFIVCSFRANDHIVGFAELAFFVAERIAVVDYLVIDAKHRKNNIFFEFVEHITESLTKEGLDVDYVVAEVGYLSDATVPSRYSRLLTRLLKFSGFQVIKAPYYHPRLGVDNYESEMRATLMVLTSDPVNAIKKETYIRILTTIYQKHYLRWYASYDPAVADEYGQVIAELLDRVQSELADKKTVDINGYGEVMTSESTAVEVYSDSRLVKFVSSTLTVVLSGTLGIVIISDQYDVPIVQAAGVFLLVLIATTATAALVSDRAESTLRQLLDFASKFFRKS